MQRISRLLQGIQGISHLGIPLQDSRIDQIPENAVSLFSLHKTVLTTEIFQFGKRLHQAECRVDGSMVQPLSLIHI